jgi:Ankyrin repeats (3 copies)
MLSFRASFTSGEQNCSCTRSSKRQRQCSKNNMGDRQFAVDVDDDDDRSLVDTATTVNANSKRLRTEQTAAAAVAAADAKLPDPQTATCDPDEYLQLLLHAMFPALADTPFKPVRTVENFFPAVTEEQKNRYTMEVVQLVRSNDVARVKDLYEAKGRTVLDCYNSFSEGLLHMSCRRGFAEMVDFLLHTVDLDCTVRDDCGRTVLHDACWHPEPQTQIVEWVVNGGSSASKNKNACLLLLVADQRGYTPFQYARPDHFPIWRQFLYDNRATLRRLAEPDVVAMFTGSSSNNNNGTTTNCGE